MRHYLHCQLGLLLVLTALPASAQQAPLPHHDSRHRSTFDSALVAVHKFGSRFGETRGAIRQALGAPPHRSAEVPHSRYAAGMDSVIKWSYPGRSFSIIRVAFDTREFLLKTEITDRQERLPARIRIGQSTKREIITAFGATNTEETVADTLILSFSPPWQFYEDTIDFYLVRGTLRKIRWFFYVD
jgi:hypothetical protein